jgi:hypothetical protein
VGAVDSFLLTPTPRNYLHPLQGQALAHALDRSVLIEAIGAKYSPKNSQPCRISIDSEQDLKVTSLSRDRRALLNMKSLRALWLLSMFSIVTNAQTVTSYVLRSANFRVVNGQLYNRDKSQLWHSMAGIFVTTNDLGIVVDLFEEKRVYGPPESTATPNAGLFSSKAEPLVSPGRLISVERVQKGRAIIKNYPAQGIALAIGDLASFKAMRVGVTPCDGETIAIYDCGVLDISEIVTTNTVKKTEPRQSVP